MAAAGRSGPAIGQRRLTQCHVPVVVGSGGQGSGAQGREARPGAAARTWKGLMSTGSANGFVTKPDMSAVPILRSALPPPPPLLYSHFRVSRGACAEPSCDPPRPLAQTSGSAERGFVTSQRRPPPIARENGGGVNPIGAAALCRGNYRGASSARKSLADP